MTAEDAEKIARDAVAVTFLPDRYDGEDCSVWAVAVGDCRAFVSHEEGVAREFAKKLVGGIARSLERVETPSPT